VARSPHLRKKEELKAGGVNVGVVGENRVPIPAGVKCFREGTLVVNRQVRHKEF